MAEEQEIDVTSTENAPPPADDKAAAAADDKPKAADDDIDLLDGEDKADDTEDNSGDMLSDDDDTGEEGVPDQYTFDPPEGYELTEVDKAALEQFDPLAKELGLSQSQYEKIVGFEIQRAQAASEEAVSGWNDRVSSWKAGVRTDNEIGGEKLQESIQLSKNAIKQFGDPELNALLKSPSPENPDGLALNNHPALLRFFTRVGKVLADPELIQGGEDRRPEDIATRMYPSMSKKSA